MDQFLIELGKSGPWAMVAGFLLWQIVRAWTRDRDQVTDLMGGFQRSIDGLTGEIRNLVTAVTDHIIEVRGDERSKGSTHH